MVGLISYRTGIQPDIVYKQLCNISAFRHRAQRVNYLNRIKSENDKDHTLEFEYTMGCIYSKGFDALRERIKATNFDTITPAQMQGFKESYARLVDSVKGSIIRIDRTGEFKKLSPERILLGFQQIAALSKNAIIQTEFLKAINIKGLLSGSGDAKINDMIYWAGNGVLQNYGTGKTYNKPLSYYGIIVPTPFTEKQFRDNDYRLNSSQKGIRSWMLSTGDRLKVNIRINDFKDRIAGMKRPEKNKSSKTNRQLNDNHLDNNYNDQQDINEEGR